VRSDHKTQTNAPSMSRANKRRSRTHGIECKNDKKLISVVASGWGRPYVGEQKGRVEEEERFTLIKRECRAKETRVHRGVAAREVRGKCEKGKR